MALTATYMARFINLPDSTIFMDYRKILQRIYSLESSKIKLGLENIKALLSKIGNPERELKCIHVAGTNGKGSVCAMIFYIIKEAGYKVGLYTSPHLKKFNERIRINGHFITDREIVDYFLRIKPFITNQSFFEITTAMAFLYFKEKNADFVVLETGLGGRLDATNVVTPLISVITSIGLEHTELLGNSIEKIASEKAGTIKENIPIVAGAKGNALQVIKKIAKERNATLYLARKYPKINFKYIGGTFQQQNKDIALTTIDILKKYNLINIDNNQTIGSLKKTQWPARLQFISKNILVDCAHNPSGFEILKKELIIIKKQKNIKNFIFVVGIQQDKDIPMMLKTIKPLVSAIIFTNSRNEKAANPKKLLKIFNTLENQRFSVPRNFKKISPEINQNKSIKTRIIENPKKALNYAKKIADKKDLVVAAGSIYLVGELV